MSRLSTVQRDELPENQRRFYDAVQAIRRRPVSGPFIVLMNSSPDLAARFAHLGHYFHSRGQADESILSLRVRAFVSLIGSRALDAPYEWAAWVNWALEAGVPQDTADAIREGRIPQKLTDEEALITVFCTQMTSGDHRVNESTFKTALDHFGAQGVVELVLTLGYFTMIALPLNTFEIEMSSGQIAMRKPFTPLAVRGKPWSDSGVRRSDLPSFSFKTAATPRIPALAGHDDLKPEHQHFLDRIVRTRGWLSGAFKILLHSPDAAERTAHIGAFLLYETMLPPPVQALTWLFAAREFDCDYTWHAGVGAARAAGIDNRLIDELEHCKPLAAASAEQKILFDFCLQLMRGNHHIDDKTYRAAVDRFGIAASVQIAASLGYMVMMSFIANAFDIVPAVEETRPAL